MMIHQSMFAVAIIACNVNFLWQVTGYAQEVHKTTRFFRYNLIEDQEISREGFDLGEVRAGDQIGIQIFFQNYTEKPVVVRPSSRVLPQIKLDSEQVVIAPNDGQLVFVTITVPKTPKVLEQAFLLECFLNKSARLFCSFNSKIVGLATFAKTEIRHEFGESDSQPSRITFSVPLLLSNKLDLKRLRSRCIEPMTFLSTQFKELDGMPTMDVSFDPKDVPKIRLNGEIVLDCDPLGTSSSLNLTLIRKSELEIYPERIVLKRSTNSSKLIGEAILKCRHPNVDIASVQLKCETAGGEIIECRLEKMSDRIGRVYLSLNRTEGSPTVSKLDLLFDANDGAKDWNIFASAFIAN